MMNGNSDALNSENSSPPSLPTTVIKYEKSSCLFCNEWFDSQTFTEHLIHCGQVLEQCPNTCNVFVPRIRMRTHLKECPRGKQRLSTGNLSNSNSMERIDQLAETRLNSMEQDITTLRSVLNEEIRQRLHLITDVGNLRKQNQIADDGMQNLEETLKGLKTQLKDENTARCFEVEQCQNDFRYCYDVLQAFKSEMSNEIETIQTHINQLSMEVAGHQNLLNDNLMKLEEMVLEQEKANRDKFIEIEDFLAAINGDLKTKFTTNNELSSKQATLDYEVKSMKNIVCETEERCDKLETIAIEIDRKLHHTMQGLADLEHHLATQQRLTSIQNTKGHLIWRIKDYSKKLEESKQYDTILHSAMFSNRPYGYALRLDIHLNGKGMWKGRNIIACLNVIAGEYDPLLTWPCRLQADVIIRDQTTKEADKVDYLKRIYVRKKSDEYFNTNQYFHIPHKAVASGNYLRNDCLFIEVRVLNESRESRESRMISDSRESRILRDSRALSESRESKYSRDSKDRKK